MSQVLIDAGIEPDPVIEAYKKDVDRTLIRENLRRGVDERLQILLAMQRFAEEARRAREEERHRRLDKALRK